MQEKQQQRWILSIVSSADSGIHEFEFMTWQEAVKGLETWLELNEHARAHYKASIEQK